MRRSLALFAMLVVIASVAAAAAPEDVFPQSVASGDPRPDSVVLWTRIVTPESEGGPGVPLVASLEVATDAAFGDVVLTEDVPVAWDREGIVKVLVDGLEPYTTYYYRFSYFGVTSHVGRTKTAPSPDMDVPVKFAVVYCQDYVDRYYNAYLELLRQYGPDDVDFVVHLGDVIYETTGGSYGVPAQTARAVTFRDPAGTIPDGDLQAANTLSNYRDLYQIYGSDPAYQRVHERWPMIVIWDDHEFSNDCWDATATYTDGRQNEYEPDRRRNAGQAFFEYMPIAVGIGEDGFLDINASILYPNTVIYRDFRFGKQVHLVVTDDRTYRPDHLVPENGFPGTIVMDQAAVEEMLPYLGLDFAQVKDSFDPYVNMDALGLAVPILRNTATLIAAGAYQMENPALDITAAVTLAKNAMRGNVSTTYLNALYAGAGYAPPFSQAVQAQLPRGLSFLYLGKQAIYSSMGSRTALLFDPFNLYAAYLYLTKGPEVEDVYGGVQTAWLQGVLTSSDAHWKIVGQAVMMTPEVIDFTNPMIAPLLPADFPDYLKTRLLINADDFNGFPQKRLELLGLYSVVPDTVVISGDIHATFVTDHTNGVYEFTPPSISSATQGDFVLQAARELLGPTPEVDQLVANLGALLQISSLEDQLVSPSDIVYDNPWAHGFMVMEADAQELEATIYEIPSTEIHTSYYDDPEALDTLFHSLTFTVRDGQLIPPGQE
jgi:alkaline phosphatase D